jgi:hypothetical protein
MRYRRGIHRSRHVLAQRKEARHRDRVDVLDGVDDVVVVLGLGDLHLQQASAGQLGGHPAAGLQRHLADCHARNHVQPNNERSARAWLFTVARNMIIDECAVHGSAMTCARWTLPAYPSTQVRTR